MALFKPYFVSSKNLNNLPLKEGQFIFVTDTRKLYIDQGGARVEASPSLLLGNTADKAFYGDKGQILWNAYGESTKGDPNTPIYIKNGTPTPITTLSVSAGGTGVNNVEDFKKNFGIKKSASLDTFDISTAKADGFDVERIPTVKADGKMEVGNAIDFHYDNTKKDYATRISVSENGAVNISNPITVSQVNGNASTATKLKDARTISLTGAVSGSVSFDGSADKSITTTLNNFDAGKITSGTIDIARLPAGALERCVIVADDTARFKLTTANVQLGDTVKVTATNTMYMVVDDTKLNSAAGYIEYTSATATKATNDGSGQNIAGTYIKGLSASGRTITYTKGNGTTGTITTQDTTYNDATQSVHGLMSTADKTKLDGIATGATKNVASSTTPKANGTATVGSEANFARGDHVHPLQTTVSGNAGTATKLATKRTISLAGDVTGSTSFDGSADASITVTNNRRYFSMATCSTAAATAAKIITVSNSKFVLEAGSMICVKFTNTNSASNVTLQIGDNGTAAKIWWNNALYTGNSNTICGTANRYIFYTWDGTNWIWSGASIDTNDNTFTSAYCSTAATTAAKAASCSNYILTNNTYLHIVFTNANTVQGALTLNVNGQGAKPIYINGAVTSASNYTLPAGSYICFYDGASYQFRTDGKLPGKIQMADQLTTARTISLSGGVTGSGTFNGSSNLTIATTLASHTHNYAGSSTAGGSATSAVKLDTSTAGSATQPVYFSGGKPVAITGAIANNITGNAATATSDGNGQNIANTYIKGLSVNGRTITYTKGNGTTGTITTQDTTYGVATTSANGLMSAADKTALNSVQSFAKIAPFDGINNGFDQIRSVVIKDDGVMEVGKYIDFHYQKDSKDYYSRISVNSDGSLDFNKKLNVNGGLLTNSIRNNKNYIVFPEDGSYDLGANTVTGQIQITLPHAWSSTMIRFTVDIYNYRFKTTTISYTIGGYPYTADKSWKAVSAICTAPINSNHGNLTVRFCGTETASIVTIGEIDTIWEYPKIQIKDILIGHSNTLQGQWESGWNIIIGTTQPTVQETISNTNSAYKSKGFVNPVYLKLGNTTKSFDGLSYNTSGSPLSFTLSEIGAAATSHTHNYAGSSSAGGAATSANKLNTNAGSISQPVYFKDGVPVAITGSISNSTTGNAATVTSTTTNPTSIVGYYIPFVTGTGNQGLKINNGILYYTLEGTASEVGRAIIQAGNNAASGTAGNKIGEIRLYGRDAGCTYLTPSNNTGSNITLTLPASAGTLARTADNVASATKLQTARTISLTGGVTGSGSFDGSANLSIATTLANFDASKITSGTISIARLPAGALERCVVVADDAARFKLTTSNVQLGDTVKVTSTEKMYMVIDESKLSSEGGYTVYTAGSATQATNDGSGQNIASTYIKGLSVSGRTITYTKGNGTTGTITTQDTTYAAATQTAQGLMSANDKKKLDGIATGATANTAATTVPLVAGTAAVGTNAAYARADHVHPAQTTITGNAGSATKLNISAAVGSVNEPVYFTANGVPAKTTNIHLTNNSGTYSPNSWDLQNYIQGTIGANDYWRIGGGASASDTSFMEIATGDNGNEPIYVRQYASKFTSEAARTLTLLDASGNTSIPGKLTVGKELAVTGAATLSSTLGVTGATTLNSTLTTNGAATLKSTLGVSGATTLSSTLAVTGTSTFTGKTIHNGRISVPTVESQFLSGFNTDNASIIISTKQSENGYHPILKVTARDNHVANIGGYRNDFGFYGFKAGRTDNGTDWRFVVDTATGNWTCTHQITAPTFNGNATSATKLTTSAGNATTPIYFSDGKPVAIIGTIANSTTGNAATVTSAVTNPTSITAYHIPFVTGTGNQGLKINNGILYYTLEGTASEVGTTIIQVGNTIASGREGNKYGQIRLCGTNTGYTYLTPGNNTTSNININLPSSAGTLARTVDNVASATKVTTTNSNTRKVYVTGTDGAGTQSLYYDTGVYLSTTGGRLETGSISVGATSSQAGPATLQYDSSFKCIKFVFA